MGAKPCQKCTALEKEKDPKGPMCGSCYSCKQKFRGWGSRCPDCQSHDLECPHSPANSLVAVPKFKAAPEYVAKFGGSGVKPPWWTKADGPVREEEE